MSMSDFDPYALLGLPPDADEPTIRARYLALTRAHPPDRDPERFAQIKQAYDLVRDPERRLRALLLEFETSDSLAALRRDVQIQLSRRRLATAELLSLADLSS
ncbi:heat shock protein DnaJ domain protein [Isosphaera pallida ATCC 43644]|jgi:curved DNA-binding protein CbpA|uniref:Heat shock protein DnaJ domain protein n=1 Tax=Isosphaera pallida (strain ATCC 43644 / DSM 9630 / IS1B) TaxID=575540 RepID=E8R3X1_ISOPI|nr:J domain-containing protein [Isosphaera pallida]ADV63701.1 heat shock protein DnaJ domain protein [Isosphaera pallida ATCC 43644]